MLWVPQPFPYIIVHHQIQKFTWWPKKLPTYFILIISQKGLSYVIGHTIPMTNGNAKILFSICPSPKIATGFSRTPVDFFHVVQEYKMIYVITQQGNHIISIILT